MLIPEDSLPPLRTTIYCCDCTSIERRGTQRVARPSWRIYWYPEGGGGVDHHAVCYEARDDNVLVISPHTPIRHLLLRRGARIFYVHARVGQPYDSLTGKVFSISLDRAAKAMMVRLMVPETAANARLFGTSSLVDWVMSRLPDEAWPRRPTDPRLIRVIELVNADPGRPYRQSDLARVAGLSRNAFTRLFKSQISMTPSAYLTARRLDQACELLAYTGKSIEEIADICGFCDRGYMSRTFKSKLGTSPAKYRRTGGVLS
ncbi:MAG: AraC family transcriptional regulator [Candidatus Pacebacteria bacterium]|nr:AraC family transcriptional regulator [Candidatus Paceibacterota bacterium]